VTQTLPLNAKKHYSNLPHYRPSPAQIRAGCLKIQREWSPEERARRRMGHCGFALLRVEFLPDSDHPPRSNPPANQSALGD
jgi:hypothetical protein